MPLPSEAVFQPLKVYPRFENELLVSEVGTFVICGDIEPAPEFALKVTVWLPVGIHCANKVIEAVKSYKALSEYEIPLPSDAVFQPMKS